MTLVVIVWTDVVENLTNIKGRSSKVFVVLNINIQQLWVQQHFTHSRCKYHNVFKTHTSNVTSRILNGIFCLVNRRIHVENKFSLSLSTREISLCCALHSLKGFRFYSRSPSKIFLIGWGMIKNRLIGCYRWYYIYAIARGGFQELTQLSKNCFAFFGRRLHWKLVE